MDFDFNYLLAQWPALLDGVLMTLRVSLLAIAFSLLIGVLGGAARAMRIPVLAQIVALYVELIRNTPILVQLFFIFYGLPAIGLELSLFWSGVFCLSLWAGAYQVENMRGGLATVEHKMREASMALSLKPHQYLCLVALPIAFRTSLPCGAQHGDLVAEKLVVPASHRACRADLRGGGPHRYGFPCHRDVQARSA
jgi:His/Glu/Gln/Arg/opine family amino acid ABC transporter permease subunit